MATRMQQRRGTSAEWAAANPVLADGEVGYEKDTGVVKIGNGTSTWNQLSPILGSSYLPILGKAYDSERLDGLDSTAFVQKSADTVYARYRGSGNAWPDTDNRVGDTFIHTAVSQLGIYDGTRYALIAPGRVATTAARDAITWAYPGMQLIVDATGSTYEYQNAAVKWTLPWYTQWGPISDLELATSGTALYTGSGFGATPIARSGVKAMPGNRRIQVKIKGVYYTSSTTNGTARFRLSLYKIPTSNYDGGDLEERVGGAYGDLANIDFEQIMYSSGPANTTYEAVAWGATSGLNQAIFRVGGTDQNRFYFEDLGPYGPPPTA